MARPKAVGDVSCNGFTFSAIRTLFYTQRSSRVTGTARASMQPHELSARPPAAMPAALPAPQPLGLAAPRPSRGGLGSGSRLPCRARPCHELTKKH